MAWRRYQVGVRSHPAHRFCSSPHTLLTALNLHPGKTKVIYLLVLYYSRHARCLFLYLQLIE
jgi:hypothetical protein